MNPEDIDLLMTVFWAVAVDPTKEEIHYSDAEPYIPPALVVAAAREMGYYPTPTFMVAFWKGKLVPSDGRVTFDCFLSLCQALNAERAILTRSWLCEAASEMSVGGSVVLTHAQFSAALSAAVVPANGNTAVESWDTSGVPASFSPPAISDTVMQAIIQLLDPNDTGYISIATLSEVLAAHNKGRRTKSSSGQSKSKSKGRRRREEYLTPSRTNRSSGLQRISGGFGVPASAPVGRSQRATSDVTTQSAHHRSGNIAGSKERHSEGKNGGSGRHHRERSPEPANPYSYKRDRGGAAVSGAVEDAGAPSAPVAAATSGCTFPPQGADITFKRTDVASANAANITATTTGSPALMPSQQWVQHEPFCTMPSDLTIPIDASSSEERDGAAERVHRVHGQRRSRRSQLSSGPRASIQVSITPIKELPKPTASRGAGLLYHESESMVASLVEALPPAQTEEELTGSGRQRSIDSNSAMLPRDPAYAATDATETKDSYTPKEKKKMAKCCIVC